jgi:plasmid stabilization system protein ParE
VKLEISEPAELDIDRIDAWWRRNRDRRNLFRDELLAALDHIERTPELGTLYETDEWDIPVRYVQLKKTKHQLYYTVQSNTVLVLAIWSSVTGQPPTLR